MRQAFEFTAKGVVENLTLRVCADSKAEAEQIAARSMAQFWTSNDAYMVSVEIMGCKPVEQTAAAPAPAGARAAPYRSQEELAMDLDRATVAYATSMDLAMVVLNKSLDAITRRLEVSTISTRTAGLVIEGAKVRLGRSMAEAKGRFS